MSLRVIAEIDGQGLQAERFFALGELVVALEGRWVDGPSKYTIQLGAAKHLEPVDHQWALINHSCAPNLRVDHERRVMVALRNIEAGETLNFNYLSTEWEMAEPFRCRCQARNCFEMISGARYLTHNQRRQLLVWSDDAAPEEHELMLSVRAA
jgi:hypothetical protein